MPGVTIAEDGSGWHAGELEMHRLLGAPAGMRNPTNSGLPAAHGFRVAASPLLALGTLDAWGRPWTTIWGGSRGFARPVGDGMLGVRATVGESDPVVGAFWSGDDGGTKDLDGTGGGGAYEAPPRAALELAGEGNMVRPDGGRGKIFSALSIDLETRDRVKLGGKFVVGSLADAGEDGDGDGDGDRNGSKGVRDVQVALAVEEALGNCPKYINCREVEPRVPKMNSGPAQLKTSGLPLSEAALGTVRQADLFFLSSSDGRGTMDTNHRGGSPGFVRVARNDDGGTELIYPEFSGNRLYQTLGNLKLNPLVGLVIPDFTTSDVLYVTGKASILMGREASSILSHSKLALKITVTSALHAPGGLPFRAVPPSSSSPANQAVDYSPYNPPVRTLASEGATDDVSSRPLATATLLKREVLTPTANRYTFKLQADISNDTPRAAHLLHWKPGQHVTLDFAAELDHGWSHMREDDPQSLNDDYVRTFTVSSVPPETPHPPPSTGSGEVEFQITARKHGPATSLLAGHNIRAMPLAIPVKGFGGKDDFSMLPASGEQIGDKTPVDVERVFVAAGVGITPLLAQAASLIGNGTKQSRQVEFSLLWSVKMADLGLVEDSFERIPGLAGRTRLFVTGGDEADDSQGTADEVMRRVQEMNVASIEKRRMGKEDVLNEHTEGKEPRRRKFFLCTSPTLLGKLRGWLDGQDHVWEDFGY